MHRTWIALPLAVLSLGLAACGGDDGGSEGYTDEARKSFLAACEKSSQGKTDACKCVLGKLEASLPFEDFKEADEAVRKGGQAEKATQDKITAAVKACA